MPAADNVRVAVTGAVYYAATGTTLPTNATTALAAAFLANDVGYISEDGITQSISEDITDIKAWQDGAVVRKVQTGHDVTYQFSMLETASDPLNAYYGNFSSNAVEVDGSQMPRQCWVIQVDDGGNDIRIVIPDGQVTERGDIVYANAEAIAYDVTITAYPDGSNNKAYIYYASEAS
jgi:hypothetical protein